VKAKADAAAASQQAAAERALRAKLSRQLSKAKAQSAALAEQEAAHRIDADRLELAAAEARREAAEAASATSPLAGAELSGLQDQLAAAQHKLRAAEAAAAGALERAEQCGEVLTTLQAAEAKAAAALTAAGAAAVAARTRATDATAAAGDADAVVARAQAAWCEARARQGMLQGQLQQARAQLVPPASSGRAVGAAAGPSDLGPYQGARRQPSRGSESVIAELATRGAAGQLPGGGMFYGRLCNVARLRQGAERHAAAVNALLAETTSLAATLVASDRATGLAVVEAFREAQAGRVTVLILDELARAGGSGGAAAPVAADTQQHLATPLTALVETAIPAAAPLVDALLGGWGLVEDAGAALRLLGGGGGPSRRGAASPIVQGLPPGARVKGLVTQRGEVFKTDGEIVAAGGSARRGNAASQSVPFGLAAREVPLMASADGADGATADVPMRSEEGHGAEQESSAATAAAVAQLERQMAEARSAVAEADAAFAAARDRATAARRAATQAARDATAAEANVARFEQRRGNGGLGAPEAQFQAAQHEAAALALKADAARRDVVQCTASRDAASAAAPASCRAALEAEADVEAVSEAARSAQAALVQSRQAARRAASRAAALGKQLAGCGGGGGSAGPEAEATRLEVRMVVALHRVWGGVQAAAILCLKPCDSPVDQSHSSTRMLSPSPNGQGACASLAEAAAAAKSELASAAEAARTAAAARDDAERVLLSAAAAVAAAQQRHKAAQVRCLGWLDGELDSRYWFAGPGGLSPFNCGGHQ
jgi:chromosome segregation ATPase